MEVYDVNTLSHSFLTVSIPTYLNNSCETPKNAIHIKSIWCDGAVTNPTRRPRDIELNVNIIDSNRNDAVVIGDLKVRMTDTAFGDTGPLKIDISSKLWCVNLTGLPLEFGVRNGSSKSKTISRCRVLPPTNDVPDTKARMVDIVSTGIDQEQANQIYIRMNGSSNAWSQKHIELNKSGSNSKLNISAGNNGRKMQITCTVDNGPLAFGLGRMTVITCMARHSIQLIDQLQEEFTTETTKETTAALSNVAIWFRQCNTSIEMRVSPQLNASSSSISGTHSSSSSSSVAPEPFHVVNSLTNPVTIELSTSPENGTWSESITIDKPSDSYVTVPIGKEGSLLAYHVSTEFVGAYQLVTTCTRIKLSLYNKRKKKINKLLNKLNRNKTRTTTTTATTAAVNSEIVPYTIQHTPCIFGGKMLGSMKWPGSIELAISNAKQQGYNPNNGELKCIQKVGDLVYFYGKGKQSGQGGKEMWTIVLMNPMDLMNQMTKQIQHQIQLQQQQQQEEKVISDVAQKDNMKKMNKKSKFQFVADIGEISVCLTKMQYEKEERNESGRAVLFTSVVKIRLLNIDFKTVSNLNKIIHTTLNCTQIELIDCTGRNEKKVARLGDEDIKSLAVSICKVPDRLFSAHYRNINITVAPLILTLTERFVREFQVAGIQIFGGIDPLASSSYVRGLCDTINPAFTLKEYLNTIEEPWLQIEKNKISNNSSTTNSSNKYKRILIESFRMGGKNDLRMIFTFTFKPYQDLQRKAECDASLVRAGGLPLPSDIPDISNPKSLEVNEVMLKSVVGESGSVRSRILDLLLANLKEGIIGRGVLALILENPDVALQVVGQKVNEFVDNVGGEVAG